MPKKAYSIVGTEHTGKAEFLKTLPPGTDVILVREPNNPFDPLAIAVYVGADRVGYIPKKQNTTLAQFIDQSGVVSMAFDGVPTDVRSLPAKFIRSPNSGFPMVEV